MASAKGGVDMDKVDMKDQESMDGTSKYTKTRRRVLSGGDVTVGSSVSTNDNDGYEADSDDKMEYCKQQLDVTDDKLKELGHTLSDHESQIAALQEGITTTTAEIDTLEDGIAA